MKTQGSYFINNVKKNYFSNILFVTKKIKFIFIYFCSEILT